MTVRRRADGGPASGRVRDAGRMPAHSAGGVSMEGRAARFSLTGPPPAIDCEASIHAIGRRSGSWGRAPPIVFRA